MRSKDPILMEQILKYITDFYIENRTTPSTTQIANATGISRASAYNYLVAMDKKGMLQYTNGAISAAFMEKVVVDYEPVDAVGSIACGSPMTEEESILYRASLPTAIFGRGPFFILYAKGDSMEDEDIEEGDVLVIRKASNPRVGDIIVALDENNENTLKFYGGLDDETQRIRLEYRNQAVYGDKVILVKELTCQGILSHVIKAK